MPPGLDPGVARPALQAGVSGRDGQSSGDPGMGRGQPAPARAAAMPRQLDSDDEEAEEVDGVAAAASGSANPIEVAIVQLSRIVNHMQKERQTKLRTSP